MPTEKELKEQAEILRDLYIHYLSEVMSQGGNDDICQQYAMSKAMFEYESKHRCLLPYGRSINFMIDTINKKVRFRTKFSPIIEVDFFVDFMFN